MGSKSSDALDRASYISLATFRRTGDAVETPVWFAREADKLYVFSEARAGKVKRLRNDSRVRVAPCTVSGKIRGSWIEGEGRRVTPPFDESWGPSRYHILEPFPPLAFH